MLDAGEADGQAYLAMQYVEGGDLLAEITRFGTLGPERALAIVRQVALALGAAHAAGSSTATCAPANILLDDDDRAYLVGFGLSRGANFLGSYDYAAPEQLEGKRARRRAPTSTRSAACSTTASPGGRRSPRTDEGTVMRAHLLDKPPRPSASNPLVPAGLDEIVAAGDGEGPGRPLPERRRARRGDRRRALSPADEAFADTVVGVPARTRAGAAARGRRPGRRGRRRPEPVSSAAALAEPDRPPDARDAAELARHASTGSSRSSARS